MSIIEIHVQTNEIQLITGSVTIQFNDFRYHFLKMTNVAITLFDINGTPKSIDAINELTLMRRLEGVIGV